MQNILNMVGNRDGTLKCIIENAKDEISMSSGSYYSDFTIFEGMKVKAIFDYKGNIKKVY